MTVSLFILYAPSVYADDIVINEFLAAPSSGNPEWLEFYNTNSSSSVDLSNYYFDDDTSFDSDAGSSPKVALSGLLPSLTACFWELSTYLNNNGDTPTLFALNATVADSYSYTVTTTDKSYARVPDGGGWQSDQSPSKASQNCLALAPTATPTPSPTATSTPTPAPTATLAPQPTNSPTAPLATPTLTPTQIAATKTPTQSLVSATVAVHLASAPIVSGSGQGLPEGLDVLGASTDSTPAASLLAKNLPFIISLFLIGGGSLLLGVAYMLKKRLFTSV